MVNLIIKYVIFALIFAVIRATDDANKRVSNKEVKKKKKITETPIDRRFLEEFDEEQWHVAHLKESDFDDLKDARRSGCKEESFEEKLKKYRRSLKHDPGHLEYVSANSLPFNPADIIKETMCKIEEGANFELSAIKSGAQIISDKDEKTTPIHSSITNYIETKTQNTTTSTDKISNAPLTNSTEIKARKNDSDTLTPITKNGTRRSSDYLISSVEYYDDIVDFDPTLCPSVVDVIVLEQDLIRNYDVECELSLLWASLE